MRDFLYKKMLLSLCWLPLVLGGCDACVNISKKVNKEDEQVLVKETKNRFTIDTESCFSKAPNFIYNSEMTVSVGRGEAREDNREHIHIMAKAPRMFLHKKIDDNHFFELFKNGDEFLVKNLHGPWRKGFDNKLMYQSLFHESINLTAWLVDQFALTGQLTEVKSDGPLKTFLVKDAQLTMDAPFMVSMAKINPSFYHIEKSLVNVMIAVNETTELPTSATFNIKMMGEGQSFLELSAHIAISLSAVEHDLAIPHMADAESVEAPVNIAARFNELMESKKGDK